MDTIKVCSLFDVPPCRIAAMERATFDNIDCPVLDSLDYACMMMESHTALIPLHLDKMAAGKAYQLYLWRLWGVNPTGPGHDKPTDTKASQEIDVKD